MRLRPVASCIAALLFADLAPAVAVAVMGSHIELMPIAFGIALAHALVLGLPLFLVLRLKRLVNAISTKTGSESNSSGDKDASVHLSDRHRSQLIENHLPLRVVFLRRDELLVQQVFQRAQPVRHGNRGRGGAWRARCRRWDNR